MNSLTWSGERSFVQFHIYKNIFFKGIGKGYYGRGTSGNRRPYHVICRWHRWLPTSGDVIHQVTKLKSKTKYILLFQYTWKSANANVVEPHEYKLLFAKHGLGSEKCCSYLFGRYRTRGWREKWGKKLEIIVNKVFRTTLITGVHQKRSKIKPNKKVHQNPYNSNKQGKIKIGWVIECWS